jgi:hypothetical protein
LTDWFFRERLANRNAMTVFGKIQMWMCANHASTPAAPVKAQPSRCAHPALTDISLGVITKPLAFPDVLLENT